MSTELRVNPFPFLVLSNRTRICETVPTTPRAAGDRLGATVGRVWMCTMDNHRLRPPARRCARSRWLRSRSRDHRRRRPDSRRRDGSADAYYARARPRGEPRLIVRSEYVPEMLVYAGFGHHSTFNHRLIAANMSTMPGRSPAGGGLIARIRSIDPTRAHVEIWWGKPYWASRQYPSAPARQRKLLRAPSPSPARSVRLQENRPQNGAFETVYGQVHGGMILRMVLSASVVRNVTGRVMCEFVR